MWCVLAVPFLFCRSTIKAASLFPGEVQSDPLNLRDQCPGSSASFPDRVGSHLTHQVDQALVHHIAHQFE
jgi:hypothetical protein